MKPALLLIHGLGYGPWGWGPAADVLARDFRLVHEDKPTARSVAELAEHAAATLDAAGVERAHVLGTSLGGMVAQELVLRHPARVDRLVLACTTPGGSDAYPMPEVTVRLMADPRTTLRQFVANALAPAGDGLVDVVLALREANPPDPAVWHAHAACGAAFDVADRLGEIGAPTLVLTGTEDTVVDARNSDLLALRIPGARLERFEGCGHLFFWQEPERFAALVREFLCS